MGQCLVVALWWINDADHALATMSSTDFFGAVKPDWLYVVDCYLEGAVSNALAGANEARGNPITVAVLAWSLEWSLRNIVVYGIEAEDHGISNIGVGCVWCVGQTVLPDRNVVCSSMDGFDSNQGKNTR